jgi:hypothetical protein
VLAAPDVVTAAWERTVEQWDDPSRHEALLAVVVEQSAFAWAAARYKERGDDPVAKARLERIRKAATATMMATATVRETEESSPYKKTLLWLLIMVVMLALGLVFARIVVGNAPAKQKPPLRTPATHTTPARQ